jgi:nitrile hydratase accessory protein
LFKPNDLLAPPHKTFEEPWQAQALALADTMVKAGHFSATQWAEALGAALQQAEATGAPDTLATYYDGVISALERLSQQHLGISQDAISERRVAWEEAYRRTPHGQPVNL